MANLKCKMSWLQRAPGMLFAILLLPTILFASTAHPGTDSDETAATGARPKLVVELGHTSYVHSFAVSHDGRLILTVGTDNVVCLSDVESRHELTSFTIKNETVSGVAFIQDDAVLWNDKGIYFRSLVDGRLTYSIAVPSFLGMLNALTVSQDGRVFAGAGFDSFVVWDSATKRELLRVKTNPQVRGLISGNENAVLSVIQFSADSRAIVTGDDYGHLRLWSRSSGKLIRQFSGHLSKINSIAFSPDGTMLLSGSGDALPRGDHSARLWRVPSGEQVRDFGDFPFGVRAVTFSPDGKFILTASETIRIWDAGTLKEIRHIDQPNATQLQFLSDGSGLVSNGSSAADSEDRLVYLLDFETGAIREQVGLPGWSSVTSVSVSNGTALRIAEGQAGRILIWDGEQGLPLETKLLSERHWEASAPVSFSPDGKMLVAARTSGVLLFQSPSLTRILDIEAQSLDHGFAFSGDNRYLAITGDGSSVSIVDLQKKTLSRQVEVPGASEIEAVSFSYDGAFVAVGTNERPTDQKSTSCLIDMKMGEITKCFGDDFITHRIQLSKDARYLVTLPFEESPRLYDVVSGQMITSFGKPNSARSLELSSDGRRLVIGNSDGSIELWDVGNRRLVRRLQAHSSNVTSVGFFAAPSMLIFSAGEDGLVKLWDQRLEELCTIVSRTDGSWVVSDPEGRFDTADPGEIRGLHWVWSNKPLVPVPLDAFMRDFYEPGLLGKILTGRKLRPVTRLAAINRNLPGVKILKIEPDPIVSATVSISLKLSKPSDGSGIYDVHLFRDGQLVAYYPAKSGEVLLASQKSRTMKFSGIRLSGARERTEFAAYAFNADRVKSVTDRLVFKIPDETRSAIRRTEKSVYLISIGVSPAKDELLYAAADAQLANEFIFAPQSQYGDVNVVRIPLIVSHSGTERVDNADALLPTKENIESILDLLSGRSLSVRGARQIPMSVQSVLKRAGPDDVVLFYFSGHGFTDKKGVFYLYPYDPSATNEKDITVDRLISSAELSSWLKNLDAGEIVMILDTCHAAAAPGIAFRGGPFDSRGLGQLAYDKGMRLLAATQADNVSKESGVLRSGLLTYALVHEGLQQHPKGKELDLKQWLQSSVARVPELYREYISADQGRVQKPYLFDFSRKREPLMLFYEDLTEPSDDHY
jgi:WD40 repeat protein/uncharacterized caspase-like protein